MESSQSEGLYVEQEADQRRGLKKEKANHGEDVLRAKADQNQDQTTIKTTMVVSFAVEKDIGRGSVLKSLQTSLQVQQTLQWSQNSH